MISLATFKELTASEGLHLSDVEAVQAREMIHQLLEIAFDSWVEQKKKSYKSLDETV